MSNPWDELGRLAAEVWDTIDFCLAAGDFLTPERIPRLRAAEELAEAITAFDDYTRPGPKWDESDPMQMRLRDALDNYRAVKEGK